MLAQTPVYEIAIAGSEQRFGCAASDTLVRAALRAMHKKKR